MLGLTAIVAEFVGEGVYGLGRDMGTAGLLGEGADIFEAGFLGESGITGVGVLVEEERNHEGQSACHVDH